MKYGKYLPIGTIVLLKEGTKRMMITGFCMETEDEEEYDYCGCLYPEGIVSTDELLLFNHSDIAKVYFIGYSDSEEKEFKENLNKME